MLIDGHREGIDSRWEGMKSEVLSADNQTFPLPIKNHTLPVTQIK